MQSIQEFEKKIKRVLVTKEEIDAVREQYDDVAVVCYINSTAELKTYSDVCVTSANAVKIVKALPNKNIFFIPDANLGRFVKNNVPEKNIILNNIYHAHFIRSRTFTFSLLESKMNKTAQ